MVDQTIAHYRVTAKIGAGGMGEVYRATDTKLGRDVALKVLPEAFAADTQRMQRFQREAQVLASLNHPGIAAIYGFEEGGAASSAPTVRALVMELVEGPTLAERIAQGPIPVEEALPIARQIAEALEYAHDRGIIHRDLKPANIKLTPDGKVKILDFGLAKALADDPAGSVDPSTSPTLSMAATRAGIILGTAAYMSPEQAAGKATDRRSDVWSFGVVLWEMLTGKPLFTGETVSHILAEVLKTDPDWSGLPAGVPPAVLQMLRRCLAKDRKQRLRDIGEAWLMLENPDAVPAGATQLVAAAAEPQPAWQRALPWALAAVATVAAVAAVWAPWRATPPPATPVRLTADTGADLPLAVNVGSSLALSNDGSMIALRVQTAGSTQIYVRRLDQLNATLLSGTEGAVAHSFSPNGQWIAFFTQDKLKKISVTGGAAITLCDAPQSRGGWWADDDTIVLAASTRDGISRVSSAGGKPEPLTKLDADAGEITHRWPQILPGGKVLLFVAHTGGGNFDDANIVAQSLETGERKIVQRGGMFARYLPSGHLLYVHQGTIFAAPFDLDRLEMTAQPVPAVEGVTTLAGVGSAQYSFSTTGALAYLAGADLTSAVSLYWMDPAGKFEPLREAKGAYWDFAFSPDGRRVAIEVGDASQRDVWVYEWARETMTRLTFDAANDEDPAWSPGGTYIAFSSARSGQGNIYVKKADGTGEELRLTDGKNRQVQPSWHPRGKSLAFMEIHPSNGPDILILPLEGDEKSGWKPGQPATFLSTPFSELYPAFSPDGRWLAYQSSESGRFEVYVRPFPGGDGKWQVSTDGGDMPAWSSNGRELYYRNEGRIQVANYRVQGNSFVHDKPRTWSPGQFEARGAARNFNLHPDGKRVAVARASEVTTEEERDKFVLIFNFFDELRRIAPPGGKPAK